MMLMFLVNSQFLLPSWDSSIWKEIWLMRVGSISSSKVHSSSRAYISAEMSFKGPFTWTDLQVHQQTRRHFFQWHNFNRPGALLLLQPRSGYFYSACQKGSFALHAFSLGNRVSWQHCQEHIIFATDATLGEWCASLVLTGAHKRFCSRHTGDLSQTVRCRCDKRPWEPSAALLCPAAGGSCVGLPVPASAGADQPSSTDKRTTVPAGLRARPSQGTLWKWLWRRCKNALLGNNGVFSHSLRDHEPQADSGSATRVADSVVQHLTSKSHS